MLNIGEEDLAKLTIFRYWEDNLAILIIFRYLGEYKLAIPLLASHRSESIPFALWRTQDLTKGWGHN